MTPFRKNPFSDFGATTRVPAGKSEEQKRASGRLWRNVFAEFREFAPADREIPLDRILASHESAIERLTDGYKRILADEADTGVWQPDGDTIARLYERALEIVGEIRPSASEIEVFCLHALRSDDADFFLMGPLGLYLSALCNVSTSNEIAIDCQGEGVRLPLIGYRLGEGRTVAVAGHLGDLTGISLEGGLLHVRGNVGRYLGAGMTGGTIAVSGSAGRFIGEQMTGGVIRVEGEAGGLGKAGGGEVWHRKRRLYPSP